MTRLFINDDRGHKTSKWIDPAKCRLFDKNWPSAPQWDKRLYLTESGKLFQYEGVSGGYSIYR
jgi:hypothetical protein